MTKEELAKKKGIKIDKEKQSPSEALLTTREDQTKNEAPAKSEKPKSKTVANNKPAANKNKDANKSVDNSDKVQSDSTESVNTTNPVVDVKSNERRPGAPKKYKEELKILNIAIPESLYNRMVSLAMPLYDNNKTFYINELIANDLEANKEDYEIVNKAMQKVKAK